MNGRERIRRLLAGKPVDRPPVMASFIAWGAQQRGIPQRRIHQEPETNAAVLVGLSRELGLDGAYISSDNWIIHSALGGAVNFPDDDEPWGHPPVLAEWDQLAGLTVPDPQASARMRFMLEAARRAVVINQGELFLEANIDSGPFQMAGILRGAQRLMQDVSEEPEKVHQLLEFCLKVAETYGAAMAATGVDAIQFGDSTGSLISEAMYEQFVRPYQAPVIKTIRQAGCYPFLHVCGQTDHLAGRLAQSGAACVEIDGPADLKKTIAVFNNRLVLRGNVPTPLLREGTVGQVEQAARACLQAAGSRRLILSPGCGVPRGTPAENIRALVRAAQAAAGR
ncbi:MAG: uroporphyrinogen decarboxylase family protein [Lentisphaerae bacterium]|nr:uroporphyrinogen decarboxylase family protein [Lentisphaerota bacterium]